MTVDPDERLRRLARHARAGWRRARSEPEARERARRWIALHPSPRADVDALWTQALDGQGSLAHWLASGEEPESWSQDIPLHTVLASHPFPDLGRWSSPTTSPAS